MKKLNLICASIAALAAGVASAGTTVSTPRNIAVENFGGSAAGQASLAVRPAAVSYSMSSITAVNSGSTVYFTIRLSGGATFSATPSATTFSFAGQSCQSAAASATAPSCAVSVSQDNTTVKVAVSTAASYTLGLGAFGWTPDTGTNYVSNVNGILNASGGSVSASIGLVTLDPGTGTALNASVAQQTIDSPIPSATLLTSNRAITSTVSGSTGYTGRIDLTASPAATQYTNSGSTAWAVLGLVGFSNSNTGPLSIANNNAYSLTNGATANTATGMSVTVTPGTGQSFPVGAVLKLTPVSGTSFDCTQAALTGSSATVTAQNASSPITLTTTAPVTGSFTTAYANATFVCMGVASPSAAMNPIQPSLSASVSFGTTSDSVSPGTGTGYNLQYNGSSQDVLSYWPGSLSNFNFTGYLRVTNTGTVAAPVSLAYLSAADGSATASKVIVQSLAAGQTVLLTTQAIDAIAGASAPAANPANQVSRVRVTAPTNGLRVQSLLQFNGGNLVEFNQNTNASVN